MRVFITSLILAATLPVSLSADIRWIDKDYDFGLMKEAAGPKTGESRFVNLGPDTISIVYVRPSCGCTRADYFKDPIAPGDTAWVSYTYDPHMRPGKFLKSVRVELSDNSSHSIKISGNVLGTPESLDLMYPVEAGEMRVSDAVIDARETVAGHTPVYFVNAYSLSLDSIEPSMKSASEALTIKPSKRRAGPGELITFSLDFDSGKAATYGPVEIPVEFTANTADPHPVTICFRAFILPDTEQLRTRQQGHNPSAVAPSQPLNLGASISSKLNSSFKLTNRGNGPLHILRIHSASPALNFGKMPKGIKPGKSAEIKFTFDPTEIPTGPFRIPVDIITDDPDHPYVQIFMTGIKES